MALWAMAKLAHHPGRLLADYGRRIQQLADTFTPSHCTSTLWALSVLQVTTPPDSPSAALEVCVPLTGGLNLRFRSACIWHVSSAWPVYDSHHGLVPAGQVGVPACPLLHCACRQCSRVLRARQVYPAGGDRAA